MDKWDTTLVFLNTNGERGSIKNTYYTDYLTTISSVVNTIERMKQHDSLFISLEMKGKL